MKDLILKWALKNAIDHDGKAATGAVISKVIGENQELKKDMKKLSTEVAKIVKKVNSKDLGEQLAELEIIEPKLLEKQEKKQGLPLLPEAKEGKVVMMFPPEPSKFPLIGHAKACILNYHYAKENKGKFFIRFEDTNANKVKEEYYAKFLEDFEWLGIKWDKVDNISDHIEEIYDKAGQLITEGNAYMCNCPSEKVRELRSKEDACLCRDNPPEENEELWKQMLDNQFKKGEYILRAKVDMKHKNAAMRDPALMRTIIGTHPRTKDNFNIWPMYDFATAIMDGIESITHRIRSKEFEQKAEVQQWIQKKLGITSPIIVEFGRFNLEGVPSSGRIIREGIESGEFIGWDDPRIPTLTSLKRRGFQPQALWNFALNTGISKAESIIQWDVIEAENRKIIDPIANRYFMVQDKVKVIIRNIPAAYKTEMQLHPDNKKAGIKNYEFTEEEHVFINSSDVLNLKPEQTIRLMDFADIKLLVVSKEEVVAEFISKERNKDSKIIHWVKPDAAIDVEILRVDGETEYGLAEEAARDLKEDDIIQFIRYGFCRIDEKTDDLLKLRYTHK